MLVILDRQHGYKTGDRWIPGACADIDGDGFIEDWEQEARLTYRYIQYAAEYLIEYGHSVLIIDQGRYPTRHAKANGRARHEIEKVAYVACHLNAGGGDYSLVLYDERSSSGEDLARSVRSELQGLIPEYRKRLIRLCAEEAWKNGFYTIKGIWRGPKNISAICYEPLFMDNPDHQEFLKTEKGIKEIGESLAKGCIKWGQK